MSFKTLASAAAVAALFALPLAGHAQQSPSTLAKDSAITAKIKAAQAKDPTVRATRINVETDNNGVVTLSGTARSQAEIDRAVDMARGIEGVTSVTNNMTVSTSTAAGTTGQSSTTTSGSTGSSTGSNSAMPMSSDSTRAPRSDRN